MLQERRTSIKNMTLQAFLVAVYIVLTMMTIPVGGLKITFEPFPVVLCGIVLGPVQAMMVGGIGEFVNQLLTYGLTPTTVLWILPIMFRGLFVGMSVRIFEKQMSASAIVRQKMPLVLLGVCLVSGIGSSFLNTFALYVDSKMFGYYSYAMVFGALAVRLLLSAITSVVMGVATKPVLHALHHGNLLERSAN